jgi:metal-sulfur cluster biosynthetic enzyme
MREQILAALGKVLDPEVGIDIVSLGLVYGIDIVADRVRIQMTMTSPACPLAEQLLADVEASLRDIKGVADIAVELVWDPPWSPARMSRQAREALGWPDELC